jgi:CRISPR-associated endoribonuclease Cas6
MRAKISILNVSNFPINYDYQYGLASMLLSKLSLVNIELASETHTRQGFKFYTFSGLKFMDGSIDKVGLSFVKAFFILSSPDDRFIKSFMDGLLLYPNFYLDGPRGVVDLIIEHISILEDVSPGDECWFRTLSPIYVKTVRKEKESLRETDLFPTEPKFYENLHKNLVERFVQFYGREPNNHFDVIETSDFKPKRVKIGDSYRRCSLISMKIQASPELLKFAYYAGLGEKNAMGFGCVDIISEPYKKNAFSANPVGGRSIEY